jgi:hypothetical protein
MANVPLFLSGIVILIVGDGEDLVSAENRTNGNLAYRAT